MLNTVGDIITEVLVRNNFTTTDTFINDTMLFDWVRQAHKWGAGHHKWPFTEVRDQSLSFSTEEVPYSSFAVKYKADSVRFLQIGGYRLKKLVFSEYQIFREELPNSTDRVYTDYGRVLFINPSIDLSGTITAWGQYEPALDATNLTATTVFSDYDEEGNEALVEKVSSYLKRRNRNYDEAELHDARAAAKLDEIWKRIQDEQFAYQTHEASGGMFERIDVVNGGISDEILKRDQFL